VDLQVKYTFDFLQLERELEQAKEIQKASEKQISELKESYAEMERLSTSVQESLSKSQQTCEVRHVQLASLSTLCVYFTAH